MRKGQHQARQHMPVHTTAGHLVRKACCRIPQLPQVAPTCSSKANEHEHKECAA